jgi:hypothetical protein
MQRDSSQDPMTSPAAPARFIGLPGPGLRLRPYLKSSDGSGAEAHAPFVSRASGALPYRAFLVSGKVDGQLILPFVTILAAPDEYPGTKGGSAVPAAGNEQIEAVWAEAFRAWRLVGDDGVAPLDRRLLPDPDTLPRHAPVTFCTTVGDYFEPVCPECLGPLTICRDEGRLRRAGLPAWADTLHRFLHCEACFGAGGAQVFYTAAARVPDGVAPGVRVRRRGELYRDMAPRITAGTSSPTSHHPCFTCHHRDGCYPAGRPVDERVPAEDVLVPLFFYDTPFVPLAARPFTFAETAALIGGAAADDFGAAAEASAAGQEGPLHQATLAALLSEREQFLFAGDPTGLMALEVFHLKLAAFGSLVRGVRALHAEAGRPHLALSPERIVGQLAPAEGAPLPARWRLTLEVADLVTTAPLAAVERDRLADEPAVPSLPFPLPEAWLPEALQRLPVTTLFMRLSPKSVTRTDTPAGSVVTVRAELTGDGHADGDGGRHDLVRVSVESAAVEGGRLMLAGRRVESLPNGFVFEGTSGPMPEGAARAVENMKAASAEVHVHAVHDAPVDVVSLGLLLFRFLLANDRQDVAALDRAVVDKLAAALAGGATADARVPADADRQYRARLGKALAAEKIEGGPEQVLYRAADRALAPAATPPSLWQDALVLAVRMATNRPGFSFRGRLDDWDPARRSAPLDELIEEVAMLAERARGALIGSGGRNGMLQQVCDDFLADLEEARTLGAPAEEGAGDRTVVVSVRRQP